MVFNEINKEILVDRGDTFGVELLTHPGTGYAWEIKEETSQTIIKLIKKEYRELGDEQLDYPGMDYFEFKAIKKGNTSLEIWYIRPWKKDNETNPNIRITTFIIKID